MLAISNRPQSASTMTQSLPVAPRSRWAAFLTSLLRSLAAPAI